jgi:hypothetical protein
LPFLSPGPMMNIGCSLGASHDGQAPFPYCIPSCHFDSPVRCRRRSTVFRFRRYQQDGSGFAPLQKRTPPGSILGCIRPRRHAGKPELQVENRRTIVRGGGGRENSHPPSAGDYGIQPGVWEEFDQRRVGCRKIEGGRRRSRIRRVCFGATRRLRHLRRSQGDFGPCPLAPGKTPRTGQFNASHKTCVAVLLAFQHGQRVRSVPRWLGRESEHLRASVGKHETRILQVFRFPDRSLARSFPEVAPVVVTEGG